MFVEIREQTSYSKSVAFATSAITAATTTSKIRSRMQCVFHNARIVTCTLHSLAVSVSQLDFGFKWLTSGLQTSGPILHTCNNSR